ncbi:MAG: hypothetical protein HKN33_07730 [Pyrinomonadaceae bacterium]|nr:hypothetical protein [Pyrinomonadaceae bacterium]
MSEERDNMMHGARTALNKDMDMRAWCEQWLKEKERANHPDKSDEEYDHYWKYHKPEIMHAGSAEAVLAFKNRDK